MGTSWRQITQNIAERSMQAFLAACGDKTFAYDLNVDEAISLVVWQACDVLDANRPRFSDIKKLAKAETTRAREAYMLHQTMRYATEKVFEKPWTTKFEKILEEARARALDVTLGTVDQSAEGNACLFITKWITFTQDLALKTRQCKQLWPLLVQRGHITTLFRILASPRTSWKHWSCIPIVSGKAEPYVPPGCMLSVLSIIHCLPAKLLGSHCSLDPPRKKRRLAEHSLSLHKHRGCRSKSDCIGNYLDYRLLHLLPFQQHGDRYCQSCWAAFSSHAYIEAIWDDGPLAGQYYIHPTAPCRPYPGDLDATCTLIESEDTDKEESEEDEVH